MKLTQGVTHQIKQAIVAQLYANVSISLPYLALQALCWSLFFHAYLPIHEILGWLTLVCACLLCRWWHLRWRQPRLAQIPLPVLERELVIGVTASSIIWALGILLYMEKLPDLYRGAVIMLSGMLLTSSAVMQYGSRRSLYGVILPLGCAMLFELVMGNEQEQIVACMLALYLFGFLPTLLSRLRREQIASLYHRFSNAELAAELQLVSDRLRLSSQRDGLTGIANRAHLDDCLARAWRRCQRTKSPLSLVLLDVDYFKQFNDSYGHQRGDECLQQVASLLAGMQRREDDLAARYGGEEFALLLPGTSMLAAIQIAEKMRASLQELEIPHQQSLISDRVSCSYGVATLVPDQSSAIAELIQKADAALYQAKHNGRDRIEAALKVA